jgi:glycosyltransferase involved in cell wall biosynthesis
MHRRHVLILYDGLFPEVHGGVEHRNLELARQLVRRGHRVTLAGWATLLPPDEPGITFLRLGSRTSIYTKSGHRSGRAALRFAWRITRLDLKPYDVVETANIPYAHLFPLAVRAALQRRRLVVTWHEYWGKYWGTYLGSRRWWVYAGVEWLTAQLGTRVVAVSGLTAHRLAAVRLKGGVSVVPNGVPVRRIHEAARSALGSGPPLVFAGRLLREKQVTLLLDAVRLMPWPLESGPLLSIIGEGPDGKRLRSYAQDLQIMDRVIFHGQIPAVGDVWRQFGLARIAVQPSSREGFGLFPLEAMAAGLPVVYCRSSESAVSEQVRHGIEGLCVEATASALAEALTSLLENDNYRQRLGARAAARAQDYDWDALGERAEQAIIGVSR